MAQPEKFKLVQRRLVLVVGLAGLTAPACTNDLDSLFCEEDACESSDDGGEEKTIPILPFLPDESVREECETCSAVACDEARNNCLEDDACTAQLSCMGECDDPGCMEDCRGSDALEGWSPFYWDLYGCTYVAECPTECQAGQNWACAENFSWPRSDQLNMEVYARFASATPNAPNAWRAVIAGAAVRACDFSGNCAFSPEAVPLDAALGATLVLPTEAIERTFRGYFELEGSDVGVLGTFQRIHTLPLAYGGFIEPPYIPGNLSESGLWIPTPTTAVLWVLINDCTGMSASQVRVAIEGRPNTSILHLVGTFPRPDATLTTTGAAVLPALEVEGETEEVIVQVYRSEDDGGKKISERRIFLRAGWHSSLPMAPFSENGL